MVRTMSGFRSNATTYEEGFPNVSNVLSNRENIKAFLPAKEIVVSPIKVEFLQSLSDGSRQTSTMD
ncbi:hypothetical protein ZHAS_00001186 [Anopheles sinensis]|uniref:Uncharacterized protein n=1 Tax=Anopheles sinensis TaxID=74873 RepID=A0A084VB46_ANOSI|nr:hypothetical protein ZHAS_00001186 [Anopheles sinensis]